MTEKRKPFATTYVRKPRVAQGVVATLILIFAVSVGVIGLREIYTWRVQLSAAEQLLHERTGRLQVVESQLEEAQRKLRTAPLVWRTLEPAGFSALPTVNGWPGQLTATVCFRGHMDYESYVHFFTVDRFFIQELVLGGDYKLVGKEPYRARGSDRNDSIHYYTRKDVFEMHPYTWSERALPSEHSAAWQNRLASYCSSSFDDGGFAAQAGG